MSVISGTLGAVFGADATKSAADTNAQAVQTTNDLNYQQFLQGRGSTGSAIYPIYAKGGEAQLYGDMLAAYNATGALDPTAADYQAIVAGAEPAVAGADAATTGIFNGNTEGQELNNQAPVSAANLRAVQTQKAGTLQALQATLNSIKAIQAGKGYSGDSFGTQLLNFNARQNANTTASNAESQADITNAQSVQGIKQNAINRQIQNVNLPFAMAANNANLASMPATSVANNMAQRQQLFGNFRIGTGQFQYQNLPTVNSSSAAYGALSNVGATGNALASAYIKNPSGVTNLFGGGGGTAAGTTASQSAAELSEAGIGGSVAPGAFSAAAEDEDLAGFL